MLRHLIPISALALLLLAPLCQSCALAQSNIAPMQNGAPAEVNRNGQVGTRDGRRSLSVEENNDLGLLMPDLNNGYVYVPGGPRPSPNPNVIDAQELKLKVREMASQLLETWPNDSLTGMVALPTSFVSLDNFNESSALGRYLSEALIYEFNTRGFAVREYRLTGSIDMIPGQGEFALSRALPNVKLTPSDAVVVGTYLKDQYSIFVNVRMVRPTDGLVLRTAQLVIPVTGVVARLTRRPPLSAGALRINPGK